MGKKYYTGKFVFIIYLYIPTWYLIIIENNLLDFNMLLSFAYIQDIHKFMSTHQINEITCK